MIYNGFRIFNFQKRTRSAMHLSKGLFCLILTPSIIGVGETKQALAGEDPGDFPFKKHALYNDLCLCDII